jgi:hypothetical protein
MLKRKIIIVAATACTYLLFFAANEFLFSFLSFSTGVHWIYLPSGIILVSVLLFVEYAAIGIMLASAFVSSRYYFTSDLVAALGTGFISGFSPWLARLLCIAKLRLDVNLHQLTAAALVRVAFVFALLSAVMHQLWFMWRGHAVNFAGNAVVMATGDFFGTIVVLYLAKFSVGLLPRFIGKR